MDKFTSIRQFRHVISHVNHLYKYIKIDNGYVYTNDLRLPTLSFTGAVKLHGTNSSIKLVNNNIVCQSRNNEISVDNDNLGFAKFISEIPKCELIQLFRTISSNPDDNIVIYGEWIGPGIQKGCGVQLLPSKQFVIFAIKLNNKYININLSLHDYNIYNILEIPTYNIEIDFENIEKAKNEITELVYGVDKKCPWASKFGYNGIGEGIVFICDQFPSDESLWFKAKGNSHKNSNKKIHIEIDPIIQNSIDDFIEYAVTESRLNQAIEFLQEQKLDIEIENIGVFLRWISKDIQKEEDDSLSANNLTWKQISKSVNNTAKDWFIKYNN